MHSKPTIFIFLIIVGKFFYSAKAACSSNEVPSCDDPTKNNCGPKNWIGDQAGDCWDKYWGVDFSCYDNDAGACGPRTCGNGQIADCSGNGVCCSGSYPGCGDCSICSRDSDCDCASNACDCSNGKCICNDGTDCGGTDCSVCSACLSGRVADCSSGNCIYAQYIGDGVSDCGGSYDLRCFDNDGGKCGARTCGSGEIAHCTLPNICCSGNYPGCGNCDPPLLTCVTATVSITTSNNLGAGTNRRVEGVFISDSSEQKVTLFSSADGGSNLDVSFEVCYETVDHFRIQATDIDGWSPSYVELDFGECSYVLLTNDNVMFDNPPQYLSSYSATYTEAVASKTFSVEYPCFVAASPVPTVAPTARPLSLSTQVELDQCSGSGCTATEYFTIPCTDPIYMTLSMEVEPTDFDQSNEEVLDTTVNDVLVQSRCNPGQQNVCDTWYQCFLDVDLIDLGIYGTDSLTVKTQVSSAVDAFCAPHGELYARYTLVYECPPVDDSCYCTGQVNSNGDGDVCKTYSKNYTPSDHFCYCTESCPDADPSKTIAGWFCTDCDDHPPAPPPPTSPPTAAPTIPPAPDSTNLPSMPPSMEPTSVPTTQPTNRPTSIPSSQPTAVPTPGVTERPTPVTTNTPTNVPVPLATAAPYPTPDITQAPTGSPTVLPTFPPTVPPTPESTDTPTADPTASPTHHPTLLPTIFPTLVPIPAPTNQPIPAPSSMPTTDPTATPTVATPPVTVAVTPAQTNAPTTFVPEPPTIVLVIFMASGAGIIIEFDGPTNRGNLKNEFDYDACEAIIHESSLHLFGESPRCRFVSDSVFEIYCGIGATILPISISPRFSEVKIAPDEQHPIQRKNDPYEAKFEEDDPHYTEMHPDPDIPIAAFVTASTVGQCDTTISLDARSSSGFAGRSETYSWGSNCTDPQTWSSEEAMSVISPNITSAGDTCVFTLSVTNFLALSSEPFSQAVSKSDKRLPIVTISGPQNKIWTISRALVLFAEVSFSCLDRPPRITSIQWSIDPPIDVKHTGNSQLVIQPFVLEMHETYEFSVTVTTDEDETAIATLVIGVELSLLVAAIAGNDYQQFNVFEDYVLDGSPSYDPDRPGNNSHLTFDWDCVVEDATCASEATDADEHSSLVLRANTLETGATYTIALSVSDERRSSTVQVTLEAKDFPVPQIEIRGDTLINMDQKLSLEASVDGDVSANQYTWRETEQLFDLDCDCRKTAPHSLNLVLSAGSLDTFVTYVFELTVELAGGFNVSSSVTVTVNPGPIVTDFTVRVFTEALFDLGLLQLDGGISLMSTYELAVSSYTVNEGIPFEYWFTYILDGQEIMLTDRTFNSYAVVRLPDGELTLLAYVEDRYGGTSKKAFGPFIVLPLADSCSVEGLSEEYLREALQEQKTSSALQVILIAAITMNQDQYEDCEDISDFLFEQLDEVWGLKDHHSLHEVEQLSETLEALTRDEDKLSVDEVSIALRLIDDIFLKVDEAVESGEVAYGLTFTTSIATILSQILEVDFSEGDDEFCTVVQKIQDQLQLLMEHELGPLVSGEDPAWISASNINGVVLRIDGGAANEFTVDGSELSGFAFDVETNNTHLEVKISRFDNIERCFIGDDGAEPVAPIITVIVDSDINTFTFQLQFDNSDALTLPVDIQCGESANVSTVECRWWNEETRHWLTDGCKTLNETEDIETKITTLTCQCSHLTEFTVIRQVKELKEDPCAKTDKLPVWIVVVLSTAYTLIFLVAIVQIHRVSVFSKLKCSLELKEHVLVLVTAVSRILMLFLFESGESLSLIVVFIAVPLVIEYWIFTVVIFLWAKIYHGAAEQNFGVGKKIRKLFICVNTIISLLMIAIIATVAATDVQSKEFDVFYKAASLVVCLISMVTSILFVAYGSLLIHKVKRSVSNAAGEVAKANVKDAVVKIFRIAVIIAFIFLCQSVLLFISAIWPRIYSRDFIALQTTYFVLDVLALSIILYLFHKIVENVKVKSMNESASKNFSSHSQQKSQVFDSNTQVSVDSTDPAPSGLRRNWSIAEPTMSTNPSTVMHSPNSPSSQTELLPYSQTGQSNIMASSTINTTVYNDRYGSPLEPHSTLEMGTIPGSPTQYQSSEYI